MSPRGRFRCLALAVFLLPLLLSCKAQPVPEAPPARAALRPASGIRPDEHATDLHELRDPRDNRPPLPRPLRRCFPGDGALSPQRPLVALLDRAAELYDQGVARAQGPGPAEEARAAYEEALVCAEEAARLDPRSVDAHYNRGLALLELGQVEAARDALTRALAIDPDDVKSLAAAADLYINHLGPSLDHTETGLEYARRGSRRLRRSKDKLMIARMALLEGQALNDLGHPRESLARLEASLAAHDNVQAHYERAVALFDLCRFEEARRGFSEVSRRAPDDAWAQHYLGLVLEFLGRQAEADRAFERARRQRPQDFPPPLPIDPAEFRSLVLQEAEALPPELRADLRHVSLQTADLPDVVDLTAEEPPLSPTILGLFRGPPLGQTPDGMPRTIILYRKNLLRAVASREELRAQIRTTLLHELGHLHGEDDETLRARGLE
ncbi:MAG: metallopeptidase family protein [Myxococcales bacterium]|nr:metallopeptidase family protein [Myxococcota bacterium]MDW8284074.1 metallopeptidase family protein [Myxococcales bacterium]